MSFVTIHDTAFTDLAAFSPVTNPIMIDVYQNPDLVSISLPFLQSTSYLEVWGNPILQELSVPNLSSVSTFVDVIWYSPTARCNRFQARRVGALAGTLRAHVPTSALPDSSVREFQISNDLRVVAMERKIVRGLIKGTDGARAPR